MSEESSSTVVNKIDSNTNSQVDATASTVDEGQKSNQQQQQQEVSATTNDSTNNSPQPVDQPINTTEDATVSVTSVSTDENESHKNTINDDKQLQVESSKMSKPVTDGQSAPTTSNNSTGKFIYY